MKGWEGYEVNEAGDVVPSILAKPGRARRKGTNELVLEQLGSDLERALETWAEALLEAARVEGRCRAWFHVPDTRRKRNEKAGFLDLTIAPRQGLPVACELKRTDGKGKVSPEQQVWLDSWGERGSVCSSQAEVLAFLRKWGVVP
jgi:hypothetical protein